MKGLRNLLLNYAFLLGGSYKMDFEKLILLEKPLFKVEKNRENNQKYFHSYKKIHNNYFPKPRNSLPSYHNIKNEYFKKEIN